MDAAKIGMVLAFVQQWTETPVKTTLSMMDKVLEEELFSDDTEPVQQNETKKGLIKFRKFFAAVDATVISIITSPEAGEVTQDNLEQSSKKYEENDVTKTDTSVLDDVVSQMSLKEDNPKKPEGEDDVDKPI